MLGLVGSSGFVGSSLAAQIRFDRAYRRSNISGIAGVEFELLICAAAPGAKWIANSDPNGDREAIALLMEHLRTARPRRLVLISTVDVYASPVNVDEESPANATDPYGANRAWLEAAVTAAFQDASIVRLPALVGAGLRKNALFDLKNDNNVDRLDGRARFQFYPMQRLWDDIQVVIAHGLPLVNLTAEPLELGEIAQRYFQKELRRDLQAKPASYDVRSVRKEAFGASGPYHYGAPASLEAISDYAGQSPAIRSACGDP